MSKTWAGANLDRLNSMTKYPSILVYHKRGEKGKLLEEVQVEFDGLAIITEKIDGTNGRIILFPDGFYLIGSREELLYAKGDLIGDRQLGIVAELKPVAEKLSLPDILTVYYFEVYGEGIGKNGVQYTGHKNIGHLLFDIAKIPCDKLSKLTVEEIASWRDNGGQQFLSEHQLQNCGQPLTPRITIDKLPRSISETHSWLHSILTVTTATLDDGGLGRPEGVVVRSPDRSRITKIKFKDYDRMVRN